MKERRRVREMREKVYSKMIIEIRWEISLLIFHFSFCVANLSRHSYLARQSHTHTHIQIHTQLHTDRPKDTRDAHWEYLADTLKMLNLKF